jgi:hypothetical protein
MPLVYKRSKGSQTLIIAINPTGQNVDAKIKIENLKTKPVTLWGQDKTFSNKGDLWTISLAPASGGIYEISK